MTLSTLLATTRRTSGRRLAVPLALVLGGSVAVAVHSSPAAAAGACTPATNIEAIIDDSGSMYSTDYDANRAQAIKLFIAKAENAGKTLGAIEFGSGYGSVPAADTLWAPTPISTGAATMASQLDALIDADNGSTDYNSAFALAGTDNPTADARIFLTDGGHNEGTYNNGHLGGPPTYVLGMGIGAATGSNEDADRLQQIANDTGGVYYPDVDSDNVQATVNKISAALSCTPVSKTYTDTFTKAGQAKKHTFKVPKGGKTVVLTLTWASAQDRFTIRNVTLKAKGGKTKHLKKRQIKLTQGDTFLTARINGVSRGALRFKLKNVALGSGSYAGVELTTQAQTTKAAHKKKGKKKHKR